MRTELRKRNGVMVSNIFKNQESLAPDFPIEAYWDTLPHRTQQIQMLRSFYGDILSKKGQSYCRRLQIIGPAGSGKTCTLKFFGNEFEKQAHEQSVDIRHIYMNLKFEGGKRVIFYRNLLNKVEPHLVSASFSAEELLRSLITYLQREQKYILLTIDEIDYFVKRFKKQGIVYDLTRLNELSDKPSGIVGVTFLAREKGFHDLLDPAELSTLGRIYVEFQPYSSRQIFEILEKRAAEAFHQGTCPEETLSYIADITSSRKINGDLRYALDVLLYSGVLADNQGATEVQPEHVRKVVSQISPSLTTEDVLGISFTGKLVLLGVIRSLTNNRPYTSLSEIRENVDIICEEYAIPPFTRLEETLQDLWDRQIIDFKSLLEIGISGAPIGDLNDFLNRLLTRLEAEVKTSAS
jgi:cell division control protein 6